VVLKDDQHAALLVRRQGNRVKSLRHVGPTLPIGDVGFDGEFGMDSGLFVLTSNFVRD
jgi:hypothetical protein